MLVVVCITVMYDRPVCHANTEAKQSDRNKNNMIMDPYAAYDYVRLPPVD